MTFISRGEVYDGYPMGADCDLDALIANITIPGLLQMTLDAIAAARSPNFAFRIPTKFYPMNLPAAAGLGGAGSPVPVSSPAPGTPNETRNE